MLFILLRASGIVRRQIIDRINVETCHRWRANLQSLLIDQHVCSMFTRVQNPSISLIDRFVRPCPFANIEQTTELSPVPAIDRTMFLQSPQSNQRPGKKQKLVETSLSEKRKKSKLEYEEMNKRSRAWQSQWSQRWPWLKYDTDSGMAHCTICVAFPAYANK